MLVDPSPASSNTAAEGGDSVGKKAQQSKQTKASSKQGKSTLLQSALQVIASLLSCHVKSNKLSLSLAAPDASGTRPWRQRVSQITALADGAVAHDTSTGFLILHSRQRTVTQQTGPVPKRSRISASTWSSNSSDPEIAGGLLSLEVVVNLCQRLTRMWSGIVLDSSTVAATFIGSLREIAGITLKLGNLCQDVRIEEYDGLVSMLFEYFPLMSLEATIAVAGSEEEVEYRKAMDDINVALCDVAFLIQSRDHGGNLSGGPTAIVGQANEYLLSKLETLVDTIESLVTRAKQEQKKDSEDANATRVDDVWVDQEAVGRLFRTVQVMATVTAHGATEHGRGGVDDLSSRETLLGLLERILLQVDPAAYSRVPLLKLALKPSVACVCAVSSCLWQLDALRSEGLVIRVPIILGGIPSLLCQQYQDMEGISDPFIHAVITLLQRQGMEATLDQTIAAKSAGESICALSESILTFFRPITIGSDDGRQGSGGSIKSRQSYFYKGCHSGLRYSILDAFAHGSFRDFSVACSVVSKCICRHDTEPKEQEYFARIVYERWVIPCFISRIPFLCSDCLLVLCVCSRILFRRQSLPLASYLDFLFGLIRSNIQSRCSQSKKMATAEGQREIVSCAAQPWMATIVSNLLMWSSSADTPVKIVSVVVDRLQGLADAATTNAVAVSESTWARGWAGRMLAGLSVAEISAGLLRPWARQDEDLRADGVGFNNKGESDMIHKLFCILTSVAMGFLGDDDAAFGDLLASRDTSILGLLRPFFVQYDFDYVYASVAGGVGTGKSSDSGSGFDLLEHLLSVVGSKWAEARESGRQVRLARNLKAFLDHPIGAGATHSCRHTIVALLATMGKSAQDEAVAGFLREFVAEHR
jgi:hypothetical protein